MGACHDDRGAKRLGRKTLRNGAAALDVLGAGGGAARGGCETLARRGAGPRDCPRACLPAAEGLGGSGFATRTAFARSTSAVLSPWGHWHESPAGHAPLLRHSRHMLILGPVPPEEEPELGEPAGESKRAGRDCARDWTGRGLIDARRLRAF